MGYGRIDVLAAVNAVKIIKIKWEDDIKPIRKEIDLKRWTDEFDFKRIREFDKMQIEIDEIKRAGREVPDFRPENLHDPIVNELRVRLDHLERSVDRIGAAFIDPGSRPDLD